MLAVAIASAGCTRPRHGSVLPAAPNTPLPAAATRPADRADDAPAAPGAAAALATDPTPLLRISAPVAGASLTSPVRVRGVVRHEDGLLYVAQIVVAGATPQQRGNARLTLQADGGFVVDVPYTLDAPEPGTVEVSAVDPVSGTVAETVRVAVQLAAAR
ncbi:MAG: hypothetical protein IPG72_10025 [Ardenticatenales bacterium]|nr:hypothetical protein [Ardenticatenales bacterium]